MKIFLVTNQSPWLHLSTLLYNAEVARTVPSGAGAESALSHLLIPYVALGISLSEVPQLKTSNFLHPLSCEEREVAVLENNCVLETPSLLRRGFKVESHLEAPQLKHQKWEVTYKCLTGQKCRCAALDSPWQLSLNPRRERGFPGDSAVGEQCSLLQTACSQETDEYMDQTSVFLVANNGI